MRHRLALGSSFALVLLFTFVRPASAFYYNVGMFWKRASATFSWPFTTGTDASYSFGSSIEIAGNVAKLKTNDQVDSDNTTTGFAGGTLSNVMWDSTNGYVRIGTGGGCDGTSTDCASAQDFSAYEQAVGWAPKYANLVGYWKLNGVGSISTGSSLTAVVGPSLTTGNANASGMAYTTGQLKQGVSFDGTDDYAVTASTIDLTGTSKITIAFWLKWNSYSNDDRNVLEASTNFNSVHGAFRISPNDSSGKFAVCFHMPTVYNCAEFTRPSAGVFHHYSFVLDQTQSAANEVIPYVDGAAVSFTKTNTSENSGVFANQNLYVMSRAGTSLLGAGVLDDLAIWNTSLSATEINTIYTTQYRPPTNNSEADSSWAPKWSNIFGYWKMNNDWNDSKGTNHLTAYSGATFSTTAKIGSHSGYFDGVDDYARIRDVTINYVNDSYTLAGWFKADPTSTARLDIVSAWQWTAGWVDVSYIVVSLVTGNGIKFEGSDSNAAWLAITSPRSYRDGNWHHFVGVRDTAASKLLLYMDGELVISTADTRTGSFNLSPNNSQIAFANAGNVFDGNLDDIIHWNTALTAAEVQALYSRQSAKYTGTFTSRVMDALATGMSWTTLSWVPTLPFFKELPDYAGGAAQNESTTDYSSLVGSTGATGDNNLMSGLIGLWHLNESGYVGGTTQFTDDSGNGNHAILGSLSTSANESTSCKFGRCFQATPGTTFSCANPKIASINPIPISNTFTYSVWVRLLKSTTLGSGDSISIHQVSANNRWSVQAANSSGQFDLQIGTSAGSAQRKGTSAPINDGKWHHLVYVVSNGTTYTYTDGVLTTTDSYSVGTGFSGSGTMEVVWGCGITDVAGKPTMVYDEIGYWSRVLHANEIKQLYRRGANRLKHQVRVCTASDCSDDSTGANWKGPDGTNQTYFSELNNNTVPLAMTGDVQKGLPSMLFSNFTSPVGTSRYFQYRTIFETDDSGTGCNYGSGATWCSPELKSVTVDPTHYDSTSPTIIGKTGVSYFALSNFAETLGTSCASGIGYNLGVGTDYSTATWYWWDATANAGAGGWVTADGTVTKSNSGATIASRAASFRAQVGTSNTVYFKAFLKSSGTTSCELDQLDISGQQ